MRLISLLTTIHIGIQNEAERLIMRLSKSATMWNIIFLLSTYLKNLLTEKYGQVYDKNYKDMKNLQQPSRNNREQMPPEQAIIKSYR